MLYSTRNKYPPAKPEVLRLLASQRGLTAIAKSKPKTKKTTNSRLPELSNLGFFAHPLSCRAPHEGSWAKTPSLGSLSQYFVQVKDWPFYDCK